MNQYYFSRTIGTLSLYDWDYALKITVSQGGQLDIRSDGTANSTTVNYKGRLLISEGGIASNTFVNDGGSMFISWGGTATDTTLNFGGSMFISSGGTAFNTTINEGGIFDYRGTIFMSGITVNPGGTFAPRLAANPGTIIASIVENGGYVNVRGSNITFASNTISGLTLSEGRSATVHSGTTANSITVQDGGRLEVFSGGKLTGQMTFEPNTYVSANNGIIDFDVSELAPGEDARVNRLSAIQGTPVFTLTVSDSQEYGTYTLANGAAEFDGVIRVQSTLGKSWGTLTVDGAAFHNDKRFVLKLEDNVLQLEVQTRDIVAPTVSAVQASTTEPTDQPIVITAEFADNLNQLGSTLYRLEEDYDWSAYEDGVLVCRNTTVYFMAIDSDGNESEVAEYTVSNIEALNGVTLSSGQSVCVFDGEIFSNMTVSGGELSVDDGGTVEHTSVNAEGALYVFSGGTARDTTVGSDGYLEVYTGGKLAGQMNFAEDAVVYAYDGAILSFDLSAGAESMAQVNGLSYVQGSPDYMLTVSDSQPYGTYLLAEGAAGFDGTITVLNTSGDSLGTLQLGRTINIAGTGYLLALNDGTLTVTVIGDIDTVAPTVSGLQANITVTTNQPVVITAVFADNAELADSLYRIGEDGEWTVYTDGATVYDNATVYFKAVDAAGNESEAISFPVDNIDRVPPEKPVVSVDMAAPVNGDVTVTATFSEDSVVREYSFDGETWSSYTEPLLFTENGSVFFRAADALGNVSESAYTVDNIDRVAPEKPTVSADITDPTFGSVMISAVFGEDAAGEYSQDGGETWYSYTGPVEMRDNGEVLFRGKDRAGNVSEIESCTVSNIYNVVSDVVLEAQNAVVLPGKDYENTVISSGGSLLVSSGGTANIATVNSGGRLQVSSGGTALEIVENGGWVNAANGADVTFVPNTISELELTNRYSATLHSGTTADGTAVNSGYLYVYDGGTANNTTFYYGELYISSGGLAENTLFHSGYAYVYDGGTASNTTFNGYYFYVSSGGMANDTTVNAGNVYVYNGGIAKDTTVNAGHFYVYNGGTAGGVTINPGGNFYISSGGKMTGQMFFEEGAFISANTGAILDFDISGVAPGGAALVNNLSYIVGSPNYTLTVSDTQAYGTYTLAESASSFFGSLPVYDILGASYGSLTIDGNAIIAGDGKYRLSFDEGTLFLTVEERDMIAPTLTSIQVSTSQPTDQPVVITVEFSDNNDELKSILYKFGEDGKWTAYADGVTVYHNGTTVYFKALDLDGNESEIADCTISNIGTLNGVTLSSEQSVSIFDGETFLNTVVSSGGHLQVSSGAVADGVTVGMNGGLEVLSGGTATGIVAEAGVGFSFEIAPDTVIAGTSDGVAFEIRGGSVSSFGVGFKELDVLSGGTAGDISVAGGTLSVHSGGMVDGIGLVYGSVTIASGGTALNVDWSPFKGNLNIRDGATVTFADTCSGVYFISSKGGSSAFQENALASLEVSKGGGLYAMPGGKTLDMTIYSEGFFQVYSGGTAVLTTIESRGSMYVHSGASAIGTILERGGSMFISSGAAVSALMIGESAGFEVSSGIIVNNVFIEQFGSMGIASGAVANDVSFTFEGEKCSATVDVSAGGALNRVVVASGAKVYVDGTINGVTVSSGGSVTVASGGKLTGKVSCDSKGYISANAGATVDFDLTQAKPNSEALFDNLSRVKASNYTITVNADQEEGLYALADGAGTFDRMITIVNADGEELGLFTEVGKTVMVSDVAYMLVLSDKRLSLQIGGELAPATSIGAVAAAGETLTVGPGDVFYDTVVDPGGTLVVFSGGTAWGTVENGGFTEIRDGANVTFASNSFSGMVLANASATVHSGTTAFSTTVQAGGCLQVFSGGIATDVVWTPCVGHVYLDNGASATFAEQFSGVYFGSGDQLLSSAASMDSLTLGSSDEMYVMSGGTAAGMNVASGGRLSVASGGTATDIVWTPCVGHVYLDDGASATFAEQHSGVYFGSGDQLLSSAASMDSLTLGSSYEAYVMSGGIAKQTAVSSGGALHVDSGGLVSNVQISNGGSMHVSSGGTAFAPVVFSGGGMMVSSGGAVVGIILHDSLRAVSAGMIAGVVISSGGNMQMDGGLVEYAVILSGGVLKLGGSASSISISSGGSFLMSSGGTFTGITASSGAMLGISVDRNTLVSGVSGQTEIRIKNGDISDYSIESGYLDILSGAQANNITVLSGGTLRISSGGTLTGKLVCSKGGTISAFNGATVLFDLARLTPEVDPGMDLTLVRGDLSGCITVSADTTEGTYKLAKGAYKINQTISVIGADGSSFGTLSSGKTITVSDTEYSLSISNDVLTLKVGNAPKPGKIIRNQVVRNNYAISSGYVAYGTIVNSCSGIQGLHVGFGGTADETTVNSGGKMFVEFGGIANNTTVNDFGLFQVEYGGIAKNITFTSDGSLFVSSGVSVGNITFRGDGQLHILSAGTVNGADFHKGGMLTISSGGTATDISLSSDVVLLLMVASDTYVTGSSCDVTFELKDGVASSFNVQSSYLYVQPGGTASDTVLKERGVLRISSGGTARDTVIGSGATLQVSSGGVLTGRLNILSGAYVTIGSGTVIDFDVSAIDPNKDALFQGLKMSDAQNAVFTLTVSDSQKEGIYTLAATDFGKRITVQNTRNETIGSNSSFVYGNSRFKINSGSEGLTLTVWEIDRIAPTISNILISASEETEGAVVITADFEDNRNELEFTWYKVGEDADWEEYVDGVTLSRNNIVYFLAGDIDGNESEIASCTVLNIPSVSSGVIVSGEVDAVPFGNVYTDTVISEGGEFYVGNGGVADKTTITEGFMAVSSGGTATDTLVSSGGELQVEDGGVADHATVDSSGYLAVLAGGTATDIVWTPCEGHVSVEDGAYATFASQYSGVYYGSDDQLLSTATVMDSVTLEASGEMYVMSGGTGTNTAVNEGGSMRVSAGGAADNTTVNEDGSMHVFSDGKADNTTVNEGGSMHVSAGGSANNTSINEGGSMHVSAGGSANNTTVNEGGSMRVFSDGKADNTTVNAGGELYVLSAGSATGIVWTPCEGHIFVEEGGFATFASQYSGVYYGSDGQLLSSAAEMDSITIEASGEMYVMSDGKGTNTTVNEGGSMSVSAGGAADNTMINKGGTMLVFSGGMADTTTVSGGNLSVSSGGVVINTTVSRGSMSVSSGGVVNSTMIEKGGYLSIFSGGMADTTTVSGGNLSVSSGGVVNSTMLDNGGMIDILSGGTANGVGILKGSMGVASGGTLNGVMVSSVGKLSIKRGGKLTGRMIFDNVTSSQITLDKQAVVDFDISGLEPHNITCISDFRPLQKATPVYTLTVSDSQAAGLYTLAENVVPANSKESGFGSTITVQDQLGNSLGNIWLGRALSVGNYTYSLNLDLFVLTLKVVFEDVTAPTVLDVRADVIVPTNRDVTVTAVFADDVELASSLYKLGETGEWLEYVDGVTVSENTTVFFKAVDSAGNESEIAGYEVTNIDKVAPEKPVASADVTVPTNQDVTVTAAFSDDSVAMEYSLDGETWLAYTDPITFTENGTIIFRGTDEAGNVSEVTEFAVTNIDKVSPEKPVASADVTVPTNQDVTVTAAFSEDSVVREYSLDGETWLAYTDAITFTENGTIVFRGTDEAGNVSEVTEFAVTNIDKVSPEKPVASADVTTATNQDVTVTAVFSEDSVDMEYSLDGENWLAYTDSVTFTENGTVSFRGTDEAGNVSEVTEFAVTNIDKIAPEKPVASADVTTATNQDVTVSAVFSEDSVVREYSLDGETWLAYTDPITFTENGTVFFRGTDEVGNVSEVTAYIVSNIDKVAPEAPVASADVTAATNGDVLVSAVFSDDSVAMEYSLDGETWLAYTDPIPFAENGSVSFRGTDEAGNISEVTAFEVGNIDKVAPEAPVVSADITAITNDNVLVSATFSDDSAVKEYSLDGETWLTYTDPITFTGNGTAFFRGTDEVGNVSEITTYTVANIVIPDNKPDNGSNDYLYDKKLGWNKDANISLFASNTVTGSGEIRLDEVGTINRDGKHNMLGNDGTNMDAGDVAKIDVETAAKLTFSIDSTAAGTFYVYEDGFDKKGNRAQIQVGKVAVKAGQTSMLKDVCLTADGSYYVALVAKNVKKAGTEGLYNVSVTGCMFFVDADDGWNNAATNAGVIENPRSLERGVESIVLDHAAMQDSEAFENFVGFGDSIDYTKLELGSTAYVSFNVSATGNAKFTLWKRDTASGKMTKAGPVTTLKTKNGAVVTKTTKAQLLDAGDKYEYFVSMESSDAAKGGSAYYNVKVNTVGSRFFDSADNGRNNVLYDKKAKTFRDDANFAEIAISNGNRAIILDETLSGDPDFGNFVGYNDAADYAKIVLTGKGTLSFEITALADVSFEIWKKGTDKKGNAVLNSLQKKTDVKVKDFAVGASATTAALTLDAGEYYISVTAKKTTANDKGSAFYNVTANFTAAVNDAQLDSALAAAGFASGLESLQDDKSAWQNLLA